MAYEGGGFEQWGYVILEVDSKTFEDISCAVFILYLYDRSLNRVRCIIICSQRRLVDY